MKDSYDKDPFAEYDKYWDELDKQEEDVKRKQKKAYRFDSYEKPEKEPSNQSKFLGIGAGIFALIFAYMVVYFFSDHSGFTITPFLGIMIFGIVMSTFQKKSKK